MRVLVFQDGIREDEERGFNNGGFKLRLFYALKHAGYTDAVNGGKLARMAGLTTDIRTPPPNWRRFGKKAGPIANAIRLEKGQPDLVVALFEDITNDRCTGWMVRQTEYRKIPMAIYTKKQGWVRDDTGKLGAVK
jgi:hypothetical protein